MSILENQFRYWFFMRTMLLQNLEHIAKVIWNEWIVKNWFCNPSSIDRIIGNLIDRAYRRNGNDGVLSCRYGLQDDDANDAVRNDDATHEGVLSYEHDLHDDDAHDGNDANECIHEYAHDYDNDAHECIRNEYVHDGYDSHECIGNEYFDDGNEHERI